MLRAFVLPAREMFEPGAAHGFLASTPVQDVTLPASVCVRRLGSGRFHAHGVVVVGALNPEPNIATIANLPYRPAPTPRPGSAGHFRSSIVFPVCILLVVQDSPGGLEVTPGNMIPVPRLQAVTFRYRRTGCSENRVRKASDK